MTQPPSRNRVPPIGRSTIAAIFWVALAVAAAPGSAQLTTLGAQFLAECVADDCETNDRFGDAVAVGDFDGDGFDDLAVGVKGEDVAGINAAGAIHVYYGGPGGLEGSPIRDAVFDVSDLGATPEGGANFGAALAAADFTCDGFDDLAIGEPDANVGSAGDAGQVWVMRGSAAGLTATSHFYFDQNTIDGTESAEDLDHFGFALAAGQINSGCRADLVIGVPGEDGVPVVEDNAGKIHVIYNSGSTPLDAAEDWTQSETGCDSSESSDQFGTSLTVVDLDNDGYHEVVVGSPFETIMLNGTSAGMIHIFGSSSGGLVVTDSCLNQANGLIGGNDEVNDRFGAALAAGDFDGDGEQDVAIGSSGESGRGAVEVVFGAAGISFDAHLQRDQADVGSGAAGAAGDQFGAALATGDFDGDGKDDLAVGAPDDDGPGASNAGEIALFYGTAGGPAVVGQSRFHEGLPTGMPDVVDAGDLFGAALASGDFDGSGVADLAIGVPGEDLGAATAGGQVTVLYGRDRATSAFGTVQFADGSVAFSESAAVELVFVSRSGGAVVSASVDHSRSGGTATLVDDVSYTAATESWDAGSLSSEYFVVNVKEDTLDEPNETLVVELSNPSTGTAIGSPGSVTITIVDNDVAGSLSFAQPAFGVREDAGEIEIPVARAGGAASGVTAAFETSNASALAGSDYTASEGEVEFAASDNSETIAVPILDDCIPESGEIFLVTLSSPGGGATLGAFTTFQAVIVDDDIFCDGFAGAFAAWSATSP